jgi:unsaturated rhamnogalacturonyl hydrolase
MANRSSDELKRIAHLAATQMMPHRWKLWFWGDSIGLEGLLDASEITGDDRYSGYVYGLLKAWAAKQEHRSKFDYTAAGAATLRMYQQTKDDQLLETAVNHAEYLAAFRQTEGNAYLRYEDAQIELPPELPSEQSASSRSTEQAVPITSGGPCVFVDTMHFDGPFFAKLYRVTGEDRFRKLALDNLLGSITLLFDERTSLFHHYWSERSRQPNGVLWGRGNGWAMLGLLQTLVHLPESDPARPFLLQVFQEQAAAVASLQDASGDWHTVLDDSESYLETSIAAFVVDGFSMAIRIGLLSEEYLPVIERAWKAMLGHVDSSGKLTGVSYETFPSPRREHYRQMPRDAVVPWGQGPLLTAIHSYQSLHESTKELTR